MQISDVWRRLTFDLGLSVRYAGAFLIRLRLRDGGNYYRDCNCDRSSFEILCFVFVSQNLFAQDVGSKFLVSRAVALAITKTFNFKWGKSSNCQTSFITRRHKQTNNQEERETGWTATNKRHKQATERMNDRKMRLCVWVRVWVLVMVRILWFADLCMCNVFVHAMVHNLQMARSRCSVEKSSKQQIKLRQVGDKLQNFGLKLFDFVRAMCNGVEEHCIGNSPFTTQTKETFASLSSYIIHISLRFGGYWGWVVLVVRALPKKTADSLFVTRNLGNRRWLLATIPFAYICKM